MTGSPLGVHEIERIVGQLAELTHRRDEVESARALLTQRIAATASLLEQSQAELEGLNAKQHAIEADVETATKLESDVLAAASAIQNVRERGALELEKARQQHETLASRVDHELSTERRDALAQDIETIDEAIAAAASAAEEAEAKLVEAEAAAAEARQRATAAAAARDDALQRLQALPQRIDSARMLVLARRDAATNAVDAGRMAEALIRVRDLELALDSLDTVLHMTDDKDLTNELPQLWEATLATSEDLTSATAVVGQLQDHATEARQVRDALVAGRDQQIEKVLIASPVPPDSAEGSGEPADEARGSEVSATPIDTPADGEHVAVDERPEST